MLQKPLYRIFSFIVSMAVTLSCFTGLTPMLVYAQSDATAGDSTNIVGESTVEGDSTAAGESEIALGSSDTSYSIIDSDGNTTVNGDFVLIINHSKTGSEATGDLSPLRDYQTGFDEVTTGGELPESYPIDYHPTLGEITGDVTTGGEVNTDYALGTTKVLKVETSLGSDNYGDFHAKVAYVGAHCVVWAHDGITNDSFLSNKNTITAANAKALGDEFDSKYDSMITNFGTYLDADGSGKVSLLVHDILDGFSGSGGYVAGYFTAADLVDIYSNSSGNNMPMVHIDTYPAMGTNYLSFDPSGVYSTAVHEFQHMINFSYGYRNNIRRPYYTNDDFINEMLSMSAEEMLYQDEKYSRLYNIYNNSTYGGFIANGHSLTLWGNNSGNTLPNYALSFMFGQYLVAQTGGYRIFSDIVRSTYTDEQAIISALASGTSPLKGMSFENIHMNFRAALALNEASGLNSFAGSSILTTDTINKNLYKNISSSPSTATLTPGGAILLKNAPSGTVTLNTAGKGADVKYYGIKAGSLVVNAAPVAQNSSASTNKNTSISGTVTATDANSDVLTYSVVGNPLYGSVTMQNTGSYTYTPNTGYSGSDSFTFKANDGSLNSNIATVNITIINASPVAKDSTFTVKPGTTLNGTVTATDDDGDALTYSVVTKPTGLSLSSNGTFTYVAPATGGSTNFTFKAYDGKSYSNIATVTITINNPPVASNLSVVTSKGKPVTGAFQANDKDNDPLTFKWVQAPAHGNISFFNLNGNAFYSYTPQADYVGTDSFTYAANDGKTDSTTATVSIEIKEAPLGITYTVSDTGVTITGFNVPSSFDGELTVPSTIEGKNVTTIAAEAFKACSRLINVKLPGTVSRIDESAFLNCTNLSNILIPSSVTSIGSSAFSGCSKVKIFGASGSYAQNYALSNSIPFAAITAGVNTAPVVQDITVDVIAGGSVVLPLNGFDAEGDTLTMDKVSGPAHGNYIVSNKVHTYMASTYTGTDTVTYKANDGKADSNIATVTIRVHAANNAKPVVANVGKQVNAGAVLEDLVTATDANGDELTFSVVATPAHGSLLMQPNGRFTYTPTAGYTGSDSFTFKANDGVVDSNIATVTIAVNPLYVTSLTLNTQALNLSTLTTAAGITPKYKTSDTLIATVNPDATIQGVTWSSNAPNVATVDENGKVTAVSRGAAVITATSKGLKADKTRAIAKCTVTVQQTAGSVTITLSSTSVVVGGAAIKATATVLPANADNKTGTWKIDNESIATVTSDGTITGVKSGETTVRFTTAEGAKGEAKVTVIMPVTSIDIQDVLTLSTPTTAAGVSPKYKTSETLTAVVNADASVQGVTWSSSNLLVATVDQNGLVTAKTKGLATITATSKGKMTDQKTAVKASCAVTVKQTATNVTIPNVTVKKGITVKAVATVLPAAADYKTGTWKSDDEAIATVAADGTVTGIKGGSTTIRFTTEEGAVGTATVTVLSAVTGITLTGMPAESVKTVKGDSFTLTPVIAPDDTNNKSVTWVSSNPAVASVDTNGKVIALTAGTTVITATTVGKNALGQSLAAKYTLNVVCEPTGITLNSTGETLTKGGTFTLVPTITPADATDKSVTWSVTKLDGSKWEDTNAAVTVDSKGKVTATGLSDTKKAMVWAVTSTGQKAGCVFNIVVPVEGVTITGEGVVSGKKALSTKDSPLQLTANVAPFNADNKAVTWSSSNPKVVAVDTDGIITPIAKGSAVITVTTLDRAKKASVTVTVTDPVTSISLNATNIELAKGKSYSLSCNVLPITASNRNVIWTLTDMSDNPIENNPKTSPVSVVNGIVTAKAFATAGYQVKAVATAADGSKVFAACTVTVIDNALTALKFNNPVVTLYANIDKVPTSTESGSTTLMLVARTSNMTVSDADISYDADKVIWKSTNGNIVDVDKTGKVTAKGKGSATITATATDGSGKTANATVTVKKLVESITFNTSELTVAQGKTATIKATVFPPDADLKSLSWTSSDMVKPQNVTVSNGVITVKVTAPTGDANKVTITAAAQDKSNVKAQAAVTVMAAPKTVTITGENAVNITKTISLTAEVKDASGNAGTVSQTVLWSSSNPKIASVDANTGVVTAVAKGSVTIYAKTTDGSNLSGSKNISVNVPVTGVSLNKTALFLTKNSSEPLLKTIAPGNATNAAVTWDEQEGDDPDITVDKYGTVKVLPTASMGDTATIIVTTNDGGFKASCKVTVVDVRVTGVKLDKPSYDFTGDANGSLASAGTLQLTATVAPATAYNKNVIWSSSNTAIVEVDSTGLATPKGFGTAKITATTEDGLKPANCTVNVYPIAKTDTLSAVTSSQMIELASAGKLATTFCDVQVKNKAGAIQNAGLFTYTSSNSKVATVDASGKVTATENGVAGSTVITATLTGDPLKRKVTFTVTVVPKQVKTIDVSYSLPNADGIGSTPYTNADIQLLFASGQRIELSAVQTAADGTPVTVKPNWSSSNPNIASIVALDNSRALVTIKKAGTVNITVQANDKFKTSRTIKLTVYDFTPAVNNKITVNKKSVVDDFGYTSNSFGLTLLSGTGITAVDTDTVKLGNIYLPKNLFTVQSSGESWVVKADKTLKPGEYTVKVLVTVKDSALGGPISTVTGTDTIQVPVTLNVIIIDVKPTVDVTIPSVYLFYKNERYPIAITGSSVEQVTGIALENNKAPSFTSNFAVEKDGGVWYLKRSTNPYNSAGASGYVVVSLKNYADPIRVPVTVATFTEKPNLTAQNIVYNGTTKSFGFTVFNKKANAPLTGFTAALDGTYSANNQFSGAAVADNSLSITFKDTVTVTKGTTYTARLNISNESEWMAPISMLVSLTVPRS